MIPTFCVCGAAKQAGRCPQCNRGKRLYDSRWDRLSKRIRRERPLCERCKGVGRTTAATEVHHIQAASGSPELMYDPQNLMSLCHECHEEIEGRTMPTRFSGRTRGGETDAGGDF